ncbi:MAG: NAD(P)/FAD-dependent oxidoreductase [Clostridia bacterium]|nr:NAD(P)/FAD-dependent oxidoreductase [Clostridia bacterium]MDE6472430.1 NAD(P)/FAD-dependent oxidoreductase [Clostridia bacterium]
MKVVVVGGGASGMMCAVLLAQNGADVTLIEKNEKLGKKLFITGKGRCNVTNDCQLTEFFENIVTNGKFMTSALYGFSPKDTMDFFEDRGVKLKVERGNRVFPQSDKSSDIIRCFEKALKVCSVEVRLNTCVKSILVDENGAYGVKIDTDERILADKVVIATGGITYQATGSTGDGYKWAKALGHNVIEPKPALVPILLKEQYGLQGLSLKNVCASVKKEEKMIFSQFGEMLFTHTGVSGPIILSLSSLINKHYSAGKFDGKYYLCVDLKPALSDEVLQNRLIREFAQRSNTELKNVLPALMPKSLVSVVIKQSGLNEKQAVNSITKEQRERLAYAIKNMTFTIVGLENVNAGIITSGGVDCKQINPKDMMSKLINNLYFVGEVLDIDALTGGFNLQLAFSTAHQMSKSALN